MSEQKLIDVAISQVQELYEFAEKSVYDTKNKFPYLVSEQEQIRHQTESEKLCWQRGYMNAVEDILTGLKQLSLTNGKL